jgi:hypothetical protein
VAISDRAVENRNSPKKVVGMNILLRERQHSCDRFG